MYAMDYYLGTMGFGYDDWRGAFYPEALAKRNFLSHYGRYFNAVEIDTSFYGPPSVDVVRRWYHATPEGFRFAFKTPRQITHEKGLVDAEIEMNEFLEVIGAMGEKVGVVLLQMPPSFDTGAFQALEAFLPGLPKEMRFAIEVRHPSWYTASQTVGDLLSRFGVAWAATQYPGLPARTPATAEFMYVRWIGEHGSYDRHDHERVNKSDELRAWNVYINERSQRLHALYGFFNNDYAGHAPATCNRFKEIAGLPAEPLQPPQQGTLF